MNIMRNRVQLIGRLGKDPEMKKFEIKSEYNFGWSL